MDLPGASYFYTFGAVGITFSGCRLARGSARCRRGNGDSISGSRAPMCSGDGDRGERDAGSAALRAWSGRENHLAITSAL